ncbi:MAG: ribosome biogenesis GTPase Der [Bacillota bacterium]
MPKPVVAIVGRPNVGKSTLFNRLVGERVAIVEEKPGVTRDRLEKDVEWSGRVFTLVDTGGLDFQETDEISGKTRRQVELAIREADVLLFLVDARAGLTPADEEIAQMLRRSEKPVLLVANKAEKFAGEHYDFFRLGLGEPIPVSAALGLNTGDLLDQILQALPAREEEACPEELIRVAVVGRPNVGKSSLVNKILGFERVIVSPQPGTTRDAIDTLFEHAGRRFLLVDTAGIRRKSKIDEATERYSVMRAFKAIDSCDVSLVMLDALEGVTEQDKRIAGYVHEKGKASILTVNKWDLLKKDKRAADRYREEVDQELPFLSYAPVAFISALTGKGIRQLLQLVVDVWGEFNRTIPTGSLNALLADLQLRNPPPSQKGKRLKIFYGTQVQNRPPTFALFVNDPELLHFSYLRYLENQLRLAWGFTGTPLRFFFRRRRGYA